MINLYENGGYLINGNEIIFNTPDVKEVIRNKTGKELNEKAAKQGSITCQILNSHNIGTGDELRLKFDSLTSHDITYVGIIQTAKASGMEKFPIPYVLTNCHNTLCAVGGTINEDDHKFALSAAQKYGGVYVPPNLAVIHSYNREMMAKCGNMILGSDSHTRYGALGTMAVGEGGGELAKQLVGKTYDFKKPKVVAVYLKGEPILGVGPQDVALSIIGNVYKNNFTKDLVMEFVGDGIEKLPIEYRNGIDVMTTETACWSSIWQTDEKVREYYKIHGREKDYSELKPADITFYDRIIEIDLSKIRPSIAMPFHPSNVYTIKELKENAKDIFHKVEEESKALFESNTVEINLSSKIINGDIYVDQGIVAGCAGGTFDNIVAVSDILRDFVRDKTVGNRSFSMSVYPGSQPTYAELVKNGSVYDLMKAGAIVRSAFCGPCFGAGDTPANGEFSIRHTTRNFANREGSKPNEGQISMVGLMDARSIAATAINGGRLTGADEIDIEYSNKKYYFDKTIYDNRVYDDVEEADDSVELVSGPNIKDWPEMPSLTEDILLKVVTHITDPVTTTDELIPSGETSSYRSNPLRLAEFTLSRKDPNYVSNSKQVLSYEVAREEGKSVDIEFEALKNLYKKIKSIKGFENKEAKDIAIGSTIYANKPGDGSAREQAASCQKVVGGWANIAKEYATKRYRSNLINWGILPFLTEDENAVSKGDFVLIPGIRSAIINKTDEIKAYVIGEEIKETVLRLGQLTDDEREILIEGCLINYYRR
ncbi:aconitate hydratase domain protein [Alkaliphilus metalliredigens QYMF]|uniref:Aconitate hydratase domain protein n=1 Tax=Alkaliphilus metalliredigens (strain QYMF) TaxID=293826 RepID=A6TT34_ALKMQ|nr:hydratase [Alkaliphilus metalliredigens]ABR49352.1 aconitate hydratase domain protein [Alkaliphilus metalliredigens QYMF]